MRAYDIIHKKRDNKELSKEEIDFFVNKYAEGEIPDYQASAFLMAVYCNGLNKRETTDLTLSMMHSGDVIDLSAINGVKVDKHSTGGVGDKTSIMLGPLVAAAGVPVAKMSGRGLGHTGGTIDKLEAFKGFHVELSEEQFIKNVNEIGIAIIGQTGNLVPADKKLYALRDVTATVENISLISGSIMSKKLASGADAIVLDVKCGDGSFNKTPEDAEKLAETMVSIGKGLNRNTVAVISNMEQPLGQGIGNSLEVIEAIETLKGQGNKELLDLCLELGANMVVLAGKANSKDEAKAILQEKINNGEALEKLRQFVKAQGGTGEEIDDYSKFPQAEYKVEITANSNGWVSSIKAENMGVASLLLGAGRETKESEIDLSAGILLNKKVGSEVSNGSTLATIYTNRKEKIDEVTELIKNSISISDSKVEEPELILGFVD